METTPENIKKPRYWLELPLEIGKAVISELLREVEILSEGEKE